MNNKDFTNKQARIMAEYELSQMSEEEKKLRIKTEKIKYILLGVFSCLFCIGFTIIFFLLLIWNTVDFLSFFGILVLCGFFGYGVYFSFSKIQKGKERELILCFLEGKYILKPKLINENIVAEMQKNLSSVREIEIATGLVSKTKLIVDNENKKIQFEIKKVKTRKFDFSEILKYEVSENGSSVVKGTAGKALVGGFFFGVGGAFLGSQMSKRVDSKCSDLKVYIYLRDIDFPSIEIPIISSETSKNTEYYSNKVSLAKEICALLEFAINQKELSSYEKEEVNESKTDNYDSDKKSDKEKLKELKEMLEDGLISEKDFEKKKKQILGL